MKYGKLFGFALTFFVVATNASAMEFACAPIDGSTGGDFDFSEICLNEEYAILRTGTSESSESLYKVFKTRGPGAYLLTPQVADKSGKAGPSLRLTISTGDILDRNFVEALVSSSRTVTLDHGPGLVGMPTDSGPYTAKGFKKEERQVVL